MYTKKTFAVLFSFSLFSGCTYHKLDPSPSCDTSAIFYSQDIQPILANHCYSCHSTTAVAGGEGLDLQNFNSLKQYLTNGYRGDTIYGSEFYHIITQSPGVIPMPPAGKLSDCDISKIDRWLKKGAPED